MVIDKNILVLLSAQAKANPRLRQGLDMRTTLDDTNASWAVAFILEVLKNGIVIFEAKDGMYMPLREEGIML